MPDNNQINSNILNLLAQGFALHQQNQLKEAELLYRTVLSHEPDNFDALQLLGVLLAATGNNIEAVQILKRAVKVNNLNPVVFNNLGVALKETSETDAALENYDQAIKLKPDYAEAYLNKANIYKDDGQREIAFDNCNRAIKIKPDYAEAYFCRGILFQQLENWSAALNNYEQTLKLQPNHADAHLNLGVVLQELKKPDIALENYDEAIRLQPNYAEAHYNRGCLLRDLGRSNEASLALTKALTIDPDHAPARWVLALLPIFLIADAETDITLMREKFREELLSLSKWLEKLSPGLAHSSVGIAQPFYLAYQEFNNKELLSLYGSICTNLMGKWQQLSSLVPNKLQLNGKIKIGIVSRYIHTHSVWDAITKGLVLNIDPLKFEIHIFYLGNYFDDETNIAKSNAISFTNGIKTLSEWTQVITQKDIEVLIYPDIGMHPLTTQLASLRISPLQLVSWGHPETTGLSTIDYYLSAELFEASSPQLAYSEKLLKLPNLGCTYSKRTTQPAFINLQTLGIDPKRPILICPGNLFKYSQQYDWVLAAIAKKLGNCQFIFFSKNDFWLSIFKNRLTKEFEKFNLKADDYLISVPWLNQSEFYELMQHADIFLDTIGFSGFNTALQGIECNLPVVTREGQFLRGNLASGILKRIGLSELVAKNEIEYIDIAIKLIKDQGYSSQIRKLIDERMHLLFDDQEPVKALENFLIANCRKN